MTGPDIWPERHALLKLDALLQEIVQLRDAGGRDRFVQDHRCRWLHHRVGIAVGNET